MSAKRHMEMTFGPKKQSDVSFLAAFIFARSGAVSEISGMAMLAALLCAKMSETSSCCVPYPINTSSRITLCPLSRSALATISPVWNDTSRSALNPPANTAISISVSYLFSHFSFTIVSDFTAYDKPPFLTDKIRPFAVFILRKSNFCRFPCRNAF